MAITTAEFEECTKHIRTITEALAKIDAIAKDQRVTRAITQDGRKAINAIFVPITDLWIREELPEIDKDPFPQSYISS